MFTRLLGRPPSATDVERVAAIYIASWIGGFSHLLGLRNHSQERIDRWRDDLASDETTWTIAELDGRIAGFVGTGPSRDPIDLNVFPLAEDSIDFDFDTREMADQEAADILADFIRRAGQAARRPVRVAPEGVRSPGPITYDPSSDTFELADHDWYLSDSLGGLPLQPAVRERHFSQCEGTLKTL